MGTSYGWRESYGNHFKSDYIWKGAWTIYLFHEILEQPYIAHFHSTPQINLQKIYQILHERDRISTSVSVRFPFCTLHGTSSVWKRVPCMLRPKAVYVICFIPLRSFSRDSVQVSAEGILTNKFVLKMCPSMIVHCYSNKRGWCRSFIWAA